MSGGVSGKTGINFSRKPEPCIGCESSSLNHSTVASGHALVVQNNPALNQSSIVILGASVLSKDLIDTYVCTYVTHG